MPLSDDSRWPAVRWMPVRMAEGQTENAPPWAVLDVVGTEVVNEQIVFTVQKPEAGIPKTHCVMFNGPTILEFDQDRRVGNGTIDFPCQVLVDSESIDALDTLKVAPEKWGLEKVNTGELEVPPCAFYYYSLGPGGVDMTHYIAPDPCPEEPSTTTQTVITSFDCDANGVLSWEECTFTYHLCGHSFINCTVTSCALATTPAP